MSTLKKVLALSLVLAMVFVMMAGAVTPFEDDSTIASSASEAVSMMSALGVINGFTDNTFRPEDTVTRAQMAKMIYVVMNFGSEKNAEYFANVVKPFSDTKGHWAEGFINFCYINGIISGRGDGTFDPDATVTGLEAAKMCLALIGYDAAKVGLVGSQWAINAASLGTQKGLFEDYSASLELAAPRQFAAQMLYNTLDAIMVKWDADNASYYDVTILENALTVGSQYLSLATETGRLVQAEGLGYDISDDTDKIAIFDEDGYYDGDENPGYYTDEFTYSGGIEDFGLTVKVLYNTKTNKAYGVFPTGDDKYVTAIKNDIDVSNGGDTVTIDDTDYDLYGEPWFEGGYFVNNNYEGNYDGYDISGASSDPVKLVVDKDKNVLFSMVTARSFAKISGATASKIVFAPAAKDNSDPAKTITDIDDMTLYSGYKVDDYVFTYYDELKDSLIVEKAPSVTATVTSITGTTAVDVEGDDSDIYMNKAKTASGTYGFARDTYGALTDVNPTIGNEYTFYLDGALYVYADGDSDSVSDKDYAVVESSAYTVGTGGSLYGDKAEVKILKADGTEAVYTLAKSGSNFVYNDGEDDVTVTNGGATIHNISYLDNKLVSYDFDDDDIQLTLAGSGLNDADEYVKDDNKFEIGAGSKLVKDDATFFVYETDEWNVYTAADIKDDVTVDIPDEDAIPATYINDGSYVIVAAFASTDSVPSYESGDVYGFVVNDPEKIKDGDDYYNVYYLWTGAKIESFMSESNATAAVNVCKGVTMEGSLKLTLDGDGYITGVMELDKGNIVDVETIGSTTYLTIQTGPDADDEALYEVDADDTTVIYVDSDAGEGSTVGSFYTTGDAEDFNPNCAFTATAGVLDAIVIDIGNDITQ